MEREVQKETKALQTLLILLAEVAKEETKPKGVKCHSHILQWKKIITDQSTFDQEPLFRGALDTLNRKPSLILFVGNCEEAKINRPES